MTSDADAIQLRGRYTGFSLRLKITGTNGLWERNVILNREEREIAANRETRDKIEELERSTASSIATVDHNRKVQIRQATSDELSELETTEDKIGAIDRRYPRPEIPYGTVPLRAIRIVTPAIVEVADGRTFYLDGVTCSAKGLEYLSRRIINTETTLLIVPVHKRSDHPIAADMWIRDESDGQTSYSSAAETALTSGWCDVQPGTSSTHKDRYTALVGAFSKERAKAMSNVR